VVAEFASDYPQEYSKWHKESNSIVVVAAKDERELYAFREKLSKKGLKYSEFLEPDIGWSLTALAIVPCEQAKKVCSNFPLAGKKNHPNGQEILNKTFDVVDAMMNCEQTKGMSVLDHGVMVKDYLFDLVGFLRDGKEYSKQWRFPEWLFNHSKDIVNSLLDDYTLEKYAIFHDCGKPACKVTDQEGKAHFPNHAEKSYEVWNLISEDKQVAELILHDMDIHTIKAEELPQFCKKKEAVSHLLVGLAEVHANAHMFGGLNSDSFKIKWKQLDKRGKAICKLLFEESK
jgi:hypothetical protein